MDSEKIESCYISHNSGLLVQTASNLKFNLTISFFNLGISLSGFLPCNSGETRQILKFAFFKIE